MQCETVTTKAGITKYNFQERYIDPFCGLFVKCGGYSYKKLLALAI